MSWLKQRLASHWYPMNEMDVLDAIERVCSLPRQWEVSHLFYEARIVHPDVAHEGDVRPYFLLSCLERLLTPHAMTHLDDDQRHTVIRLLAQAARMDRGWPNILLERWVGIIGRERLLRELPVFFARMPAPGDRNLFALAVAVNDETVFSHLVAHFQNQPQRLRDLALLIWAAARTAVVPGLVGDAGRLALDERDVEGVRDGRLLLERCYAMASGCIRAFDDVLERWHALGREPLTETAETRCEEGATVSYQFTTTAGASLDFLVRCMAGIAHYLPEAAYQQFLSRAERHGSYADLIILERQGRSIATRTFPLAELLQRMRLAEDPIDLGVLTAPRS